ncbi:MAG TPA: MFS transporter [Actinomycetota bacterium]|nr:MFS transporter [Actinomycetota bacterium]
MAERETMRDGGVPSSSAAAAATVDGSASARVSFGGKRWLALSFLCVGQLMIVLDVTVVNVALPTIQHDLHFTQASLAWVVNAYLLTFGGLILLAGRLGDLIGRKRVFLAGVGAFTVASMFCGLSNSQAELVTARFVQGATAALMASMILGILVTMFPSPAERARAMGLYAFVASSGGSIGLLVGGALTETLNWHWIFFVNVPIGILTFAFSWFLVQGSKGLGFRHGVDLVGGVLAVAAPTAAVYTIVHASGWGWGSAKTLAWALGTLALLAGFLLTESRVKNPLMPLAIFESRTRSLGNAVRALFAVGLFGAFFIGALYLQHILGYSAIQTGLAFLPSTLTVGLFSLGVTARVMSRIGIKATVLPGLLFAGVALLLFARMPVGGTYVVDVLPGMLLFGIGGGLVFAPSVALAMSGTGPRDSGVASGLANLTLQLGAALGLAVLASVSATVAARRLTSGVAAPFALTDGFHVAFLIGAGCVALAVVLVAALLPSARPARQAAASEPSADHVGAA